MASSVADVCNLALSRVGVRARIGSLSDATTEAEACAVVWEEKLRQALAAHPWRFAARRDAPAYLTELDEDEEEVPRTVDGWAYLFALPSDCLAARAVYPDTRTPRAEERVPFSEELADVDGVLTRVLLCDREEPVLLYTALVEDVTLFPPLFVDALAWALAEELALSVAVSIPLSERARARFELALARARAADLRSQQEDPEPEPAHLAARR